MESKLVDQVLVREIKRTWRKYSLKMVMVQSGRTKPTKRSSGGGCQWSLFKDPSGRCYQSRHSMSRHLPKTDTRSRVFPQQQLSLRVWDCTHSHLLHAHFCCCTHTLCTLHTSHACEHTHAWFKRVKGVGRMRTSFSISPSLFSCFTRPCSCLFCCSLTVTSRPLPTTTSLTLTSTTSCRTSLT